MGSKVYFINLRSNSKKNNLSNKLKRLFDSAKLNKILEKGEQTAVKLHFGEKGNHGYIHPVFVRQIVDKIKEYEAKPFLTDTNTLYTGSRTNSVDHLITAIENGFAYSVVGAPIIIADGLFSKNSIEVEVNLKNFDKVKIAGEIFNSNSMIVLSHCKGHALAGFGGAIKNLAMGCATASGKQMQHSDAKPDVIKKKCVGCGICVNWCPKKCIEIIDGKAKIDHDKCIGCGECTTACRLRAIKVQWATNNDVFLEKMAEYAYGAVKNKKEKVGYINFVMNVTPLCDCVPWSDAPIVRDIGVLASLDPVALDKACYDLINNEAPLPNTEINVNINPGEDKFKHIHKNVNPSYIFDYAEKIGLGSKEYEIIEVK
ncbi:hypothetical protein SAMN02745883_00614 [Caminicella sporogenes DSM 14501]|uniref:Ferredoxin n=1 Tax=Caminicella sporogenes DSM 14501 TaxID=1121266 RepID=A0A1M6MS88_9FIRM|nr:DUF362 domain-containing protein [Caminicella sporogenes]RKD22525.1 4Fe-4S ferredoxin [Caminicella sporogenes]SHJ86327.1 hypothetical protein SAMN02745883_00614 [Caminicella sporogenes DSM 14501]